MTTELQDTLFSLEETTDDAGTPPGFRLHRLELLNWGTFHQGVRTFRLDGANSLLTGDIGSGKSTVVDAITTLLLPANRIEYNKAAGAQKKERSLMSYVRGFHKSTRSTGGEYSKPVALRGTGALTVVLAVFHNAVLGKSVTLAITLWATQEAGQPSRFYSLAEADQSIAADFSSFGQDPVLLHAKVHVPPAHGRGVGGQVAHHPAPVQGLGSGGQGGQGTTDTDQQGSDATVPTTGSIIVFNDADWYQVTQLDVQPCGNGELGDWDYLGGTVVGDQQSFEVYGLEFGCYDIMAVDHGAWAWWDIYNVWIDEENPTFTFTLL